MSDVKTGKYYVLYVQGKEGRVMPITFMPIQVSEVCEYLGISKDLFYELAICKSYVIDGEDVFSYYE